MTTTRRAGIPTQPVRGTGTDPQRLLAATDAAARFYQAQLHRATGPRRYLNERGLGTLAQRERPWQIGYAPPSWHALTRHLTYAGFTADELVGAGLSTPAYGEPDRLIDVFRDRIIFPVRDPAAHIVGFIGRASPKASDHVPKYLNSPESFIYRKGDLLFGLAEQHHQLTAGSTPVLVEGPVDAIAVWLSNPDNDQPGTAALAPCGTALTKTQATILRGLPGAVHGLVVAFDNDAAGHTATERAWQLLRTPAPARPLLAAELPNGTDPADMLTQPHGRTRLHAALLQHTRPLLDAVIDHRLDHLQARHPRLLEDIPGRCTAARTLVPLLFDATNPSEAVRVARHIATRTGIGADTLTQLAIEHVETTLHDLDRHLPRLPPKGHAACLKAARLSPAKDAHATPQPVGFPPPAAVTRPARSRTR